MKSPLTWLAHFSAAIQEGLDRETLMEGTFPPQKLQQTGCETDLRFSSRSLIDLRRSLSVVVSKVILMAANGIGKILPLASLRQNHHLGFQKLTYHPYSFVGRRSLNPAILPPPLLWDWLCSSNIFSIYLISWMGR